MTNDTGHAIDHVFTRATGLTDDDRETGGLGFENDVACGVRPTRKQKQISRRKCFGDIVAPQPAGEDRFRTVLLEPRPQRAIARHDQSICRTGRAQLLQDRRERLQSLFAGQPPNIQDGRSAL